MGCTSSSVPKTDVIGRSHSSNGRTPFKTREQQLSFVYTAKDADGNSRRMSSFGTRSKIKKLFGDQIEFIDDDGGSNSPEHRVYNPIHPDHKHILQVAIQTENNTAPISQEAQHKNTASSPTPQYNFPDDDAKSGDDDYEEARRSAKQTHVATLYPDVPPLTEPYHPSTPIQTHQHSNRPPPDFKKAKARHEQMQQYHQPQHYNDTQQQHNVNKMISILPKRTQNIPNKKMESISSHDYYKAKPEDHRNTYHDDRLRLSSHDTNDDQLRFTPLFSPNMKFDYTPSGDVTAASSSHDPPHLSLSPTYRAEQVGHGQSQKVREVRYHYDQKDDDTMNAGDYDMAGDLGEEWITSPRQDDHITSPTKEYPNLHLLFDQEPTTHHLKIVSSSPDQHGSADDFCFESTPIIYPDETAEFDVDISHKPALSIPHPHSRRPSTKKKPKRRKSHRK